MMTEHLTEEDVRASALREAAKDARIARLQNALRQIQPRVVHLQTIWVGTSLWNRLRGPLILPAENVLDTIEQALSEPTPDPSPLWNVVRAAVEWHKTCHIPWELPGGTGFGVERWHEDRCSPTDFNLFQAVEALPKEWREFANDA